MTEERMQPAGKRQATGSSPTMTTTSSGGSGSSSGDGGIGGGSAAMRLSTMPKVLVMIVSFLPLVDLSRAITVSKRWKQALNDR